VCQLPWTRLPSSWLKRSEQKAGTVQVQPLLGPVLGIDSPHGLQQGHQRDGLGQQLDDGWLDVAETDLSQMDAPWGLGCDSNG
jgi:hypothetical protein